MAIRFGVDQIILNNPSWKTSSIGFLTNDAARTFDQTHSRIALIKAGFNITKLFSPEHGIDTKGADGEKMKDGVDPLTNLPFVSLYGEQYAPVEKDLDEIDILLFDIPDAGTRFYTYLWSMTYYLEAAAKFHKKIIILDRPNPLSGNLAMIEGPSLDESVASFIGRFNIPIKHQCSLGELALYFNTTKGWNADLEIISCSELKRTDLFLAWKQTWIPTSPAIQNFNACLLYPGFCFFEATNVSIGRGTTYSFEWFGAAWLNMDAIVAVCKNMFSEDLAMEISSVAFKSNKEKEWLPGIHCTVKDPENYDAVLNGLLLLKIIKDLHPNHFEWAPYPTNANPTGKNHLSLLLGIPNAEVLFDLPLQNWLQKIQILLRVDYWKKEIEPYLLYK
jgi:uncharacterized protein YbbC (DUF1343 family)